MESTMEVVVPTFISAHLFWIVPKKDLLLRSAMHRIMQLYRPKETKGCLVQDMLVAVNIEGRWVRGIIENIDKIDRTAGTQILCWLPDYGIKRLVNRVFELPDKFKECPSLAKQASLHNVVNLMTQYKFGPNGFDLQLQKTVNNSEGVSKVTLDYIDSTEEIFFDVIENDEFNVYGDLIFFKNNKKTSITDILIKRNLLAKDEELFNTMDRSRSQLKEDYYRNSSSWQSALVLEEKQNLKKIIFNKDENASFSTMEFFER